MSNQLGHCGFVTIIGRPNVGKSTLLNRLIGQKLSITSRKPQTTRLHLLGIKSGEDSQIIFVDTPGLQKNTGNVFNRYMNREVFHALSHIDVVVHVIEALKWTEADENVFNHIGKLGCPLILALNKIDRIKDKRELLPFLKQLDARETYSEIVPVSAKHGHNVELLEEHIRKYLPAGVALFPEDQVTDRSERFFAAEFVREKLIRHLGDELPYNITVTIDKFDEEETVIKVHATIWVANEGQKKIVIGKNGVVLKKTGEQARKDMEKMFGKKVFLQSWVKTRSKKTAGAQILRQFGYGV